MTTFSDNSEKHGTIKFEGNTYAISQNPYASINIGEENKYTALATDKNGFTVRVLWDITRPDSEDESEACDWTKYNVIDRGHKEKQYETNC